MQAITNRQRQTLDFIRSYTDQYGVAPSRPEIAEALGLRHVSTVDAHLTGLMKKGWVELKQGSPRYIRLLREGLPVVPLGRIAAGEPILAESRVMAHVPRTVAAMFRPRPDYFLTVQGDSMNKLGLTSGTIVGIRATPEAENNDIVVARLGDEVTLKRFVREDERTVRLQPESTNKKHKPIRIDLEREDLEVDGVYVGALIGQVQPTLRTELPDNED
jgi:repressor LexA